MVVFCFKYKSRYDFQKWHANIFPIHTKPIFRMVDFSALKIVYHATFLPHEMQSLHPVCNYIASFYGWYKVRYFSNFKFKQNCKFGYQFYFCKCDFTCNVGMLWKYGFVPLNAAANASFLISYDWIKSEYSLYVFPTLHRHSDACSHSHRILLPHSPCIEFRFFIKNQKHSNWTFPAATQWRWLRHSVSRSP
jgi:hypothetical protein